MNYSHYYKVWHEVNDLNERLEGLENPVIDEQTLMFWNLQLQFMERSFESLRDVYQGLRFGRMYINNEMTGKMDRLLHQRVASEEDRLCLATHLALQLSGLA